MPQKVKLDYVIRSSTQSFMDNSMIKGAYHCDKAPDNNNNNNNDNDSKEEEEEEDDDDDNILMMR